jgi:hypothetical protein
VTSAAKHKLLCLDAISRSNFAATGLAACSILAVNGKVSLNGFAISGNSML